MKIQRKKIGYPVDGLDDYPTMMSTPGALSDIYVI